jgi:nitric-oxide synthase
MSKCPFHSHHDASAVSPPPTLPPVDGWSFLDEAHSSPETAALRRILLSDAARAGAAPSLTARELTWAGRIAWRNSSRCIGRLHWRSLQVRDARHLERAADIVGSLEEHLRLAQGDGRVRSILTVFAPATAGGHAPRIWNHQLCGYAGYRSRGGAILGDPRNAAFTRAALELGWQPPSERTAFDLLPWIVAGARERPRLFPLPPGLVREVSLRHPHYAWFGELGLRWYAVPVISDMGLHVAGTDFTAAPFNGWYMSTEIAARDLTDPHRYDLLPTLAARLGLDATRPATLWKDRVLLELNLTVLHSFEQAGVRMVDHHTASEEFVRFLAREKAAHREVSARWDWIVPPMSSSTTPVFHMAMREFPSTPEFRYQPAPWSPA